MKIPYYRNQTKAYYAEQYAAWLKAGCPQGQEPDRGQLSYMAAQAVRLDLAAAVRAAQPARKQ